MAKRLEAMLRPHDVCERGLRLSHFKVDERATNKIDFR